MQGFAAVSFPPLQGITYVGWPHGRSREGEERDAIFTLVQNTRRPNIRVLRGLLHCAKRDRALRRKIGHGRETEEGRLGEFFAFEDGDFYPPQRRKSKASNYEKL